MEVLVWTATLERHFDVLLVLSKIWRSLFEINHGTSMNKWIIWQGLRRAQGNSLVGKECPRKLITVIDVEDTIVKVNVDTDVKIFPGVAINAAWLWHQVSLEEDTLWDARVRDASLQNVNGVILEIVVHCTLSKAVIFGWVFNNCLLEVN